MTALSVATDEDLANRALGDFPRLAHESQVLARGVDGVVSGWVLSSISNDFAAQGIAPGHLVSLYRPADGGRFEKERETLAVDSVAGNSVTLRRIGLIAGAGLPPDAGACGFRCLTAAPQIARATYEIQREYNLQSIDDLQDPEEIRRAVVLGSLVMLYGDRARNIGEQSDDWGSKYKAFKAEFNRAMEDLAGQYGPAGGSDSALGGPIDDPAEVPLIPDCYFGTYGF